MRMTIGLRSLLFVAGLLSLSAATSISERLNCTANTIQPTIRVNTTDRLVNFRTKMTNIRVNNRPTSAYIVLSQDAHNSEYPTDHDLRRGYISGFSGSAGTAVITDTEAALWTDGRYFDEADEALDCNWILMKEGESGVPSIAEWINSKMVGTGSIVSIDQSLVTNSFFNTLRSELLALSNVADLNAVASNLNPVDLIWTTNRPIQPNDTVINALSTEFAGVSWQDKITNLRANMTSKGVNAFVVSSLDETAWLFNLRGSDVAYNPFFLSYAIVEQNAITLYILAKDVRLPANPTDNETDSNLATHLATSNTGACQGTGTCVVVKDYVQATVETDIRTLAASQGTVWVTYDANYGIYTAAANNRLVDKSPIAITKSMKNSVERSGMTNAYNRDSVAVIKFLAFMEQEIMAGNRWTEVSAGAELDRRRSQLRHYRGLSFETISAYGSNGAIIHYRPASATDQVIGTDSFFLLDSGGQYLDGTTDVTRTMYYGSQPSDYMKEAYTRVLMGAATLATLRFPEGLYGFQIDSFARSALWHAGLVYHHGTGHGIGSYLSVHEGPGKIYKATQPRESEETVTQYQYYSDEPGYYETNNFGIRLETIVMVQPFTPTYSTANSAFYQFTPITLVPFETSLIDYTIMTPTQLEWLNAYNRRIRDEILPLLSDDTVARDWVNARIGEVSTCNKAGIAGMSSAVLTTAVIVASLAKSYL